MVCYRQGSLSLASAVLLQGIISAERTISSSHRRFGVEMSGARGTVTAFAWVLVSEPYQSLGLFEPYVVVLAAGGPSLDFPAIHPIFTRRSRVRGAFNQAFDASIS